MPIARILKALRAFEQFLASLLMIVIVALVFMAAFTRFLGAPINWSVDLAQGLFVWLVYLGASIAAREDRHIGVSYFVDLLSPAKRRVITTIGNLLVIGFLACIVYYGLLVSIINANRQLTSIPISYSFVTIAASVGCFLMMITIIGKTISLYQKTTSPEMQG